MGSEGLEPNKVKSYRVLTESMKLAFQPQFTSKHKLAVGPMGFEPINRGAIIDPEEPFTFNTRRWMPVFLLLTLHQERTGHLARRTRWYSSLDSNRSSGSVRAPLDPHTITVQILPAAMFVSCDSSQTLNAMQYCHRFQRYHLAWFS